METRKLHDLVGLQLVDVSAERSCREIREWFEPHSLPRFRRRARRLQSICISVGENDGLEQRCPAAC